MKVLYEFTVPKKGMVEEKTENEDGSVTTRQVEKIHDIKLCLKKPNRLEREEGDMVYARRLSECIRAGLLTKAQLTKEYSELGGVWSKNEEDQYSNLEKVYADLSFEFSEAQVKFANEPTEENKKDLADKYYKLKSVHSEIEAFEQHKSEVFNETAEVKAKNRTITWYLCYLSYYWVPNKKNEEGGEWKPLLEGESFEDKLDFYDEITEEAEEDDWRRAALDKSMLILSFWYSGKISSQDDIRVIEELLKVDPDKEIENLKVEEEVKPEPEEKPKKKRGRPKKGE